MCLCLNYPQFLIVKHSALASVAFPKLETQRPRGCPLIQVSVLMLAMLQSAGSKFLPSKTQQPPNNSTFQMFGKCYYWEVAES